MGRAVRVFSGLTLISRFGGLFRDLLTARIFGDTAIGSAFMAAFAVPNLFRRLLGEGALAAAFLPIYTRLDRDNPELASRFATLIVQRLAVVTGLIAIVVELALMGVLLATPDEPNRVLSLRLVMVMFPFMPMVCIAAILGGMLQTHGRFGPSAAMPILLNLFTIVAALPYALLPDADPVRAAYVLGLATIASGIAQVTWGFLSLRRHLRWDRNPEGVQTHVRDMLRRFGPVVIGMGTLQINTFLDVLIAMWPNWVGPTMLGHTYPLDTASNGILAYAQRLYQFPLGVFGVAVATAVFPALSRHADTPQEFVATLRRGLRLSLFIGLPASVGLWLVREHLTVVVYGGERGFSAEGIARASAVLAGYAPAIWMFSLNQVWTRAFYAAGRTKTPMYVAMAMVALNLALNLVLIWRFREAGLAWSTSLCALVQCVILAVLSGRMTGVQPIDGPSLRAVARLVGITIGMGVAVLGAQQMMPSPSSWLGHLAALLVATTVGIGTYTGATLLARAPEFGWLLARAKGRARPIAESQDRA